MLARFLKLRNYVDGVAKYNDKLFVSERQWQEISELVNVLAPVREATTKLQSESLNLSDFFLIWTKCLLKIKKIETSE